MDNNQKNSNSNSDAAENNAGNSNPISATDIPVTADTDNTVKSTEDTVTNRKAFDAAVNNAVVDSKIGITEQSADKVTVDTKNHANDITQTSMSTTINNTGATEKDIITEIARKIIKEQEGIIGPVAFEQATKVDGLKIDRITNAISLEGNSKEILEKLVMQYELLFGRISIEICKKAVRNIISQAPNDQIPQILL